jgi:hypothetical protein
MPFLSGLDLTEPPTSLYSSKTSPKGEILKGAGAMDQEFYRLSVRLVSHVLPKGKGSACS